MEPPLHCARPGVGCEADADDGLYVRATGYEPKRGDIIVSETPPAAALRCGAGGTFVGRIIGLPGETVQIRLDQRAAYVFINGQSLDEPYIQRDKRDIGPAETFHVPKGKYFMMGDNRSQACDSRVFGSVERGSLRGEVVAIQRGPDRIELK